MDGADSLKKKKKKKTGLAFLNSQGFFHPFENRSYHADVRPSVNMR